MNKIIEEQVHLILESCNTFAKQFPDPDKEDHYGFLVTIGGECGKILAEVDKLD